VRDDAAREAIAYSDEMNRESEQIYIEMLSETLETNRIEGEALQRFRTAMEPVHEILIARGYFTRDDVDEARSAARGE